MDLKFMILYYLDVKTIKIRGRALILIYKLCLNTLRERLEV